MNSSPSPKKSPKRRSNGESDATASFEIAAAKCTENIRRMTEELNSVYVSLEQLADGFSHSREIYQRIMSANNKYGELIGGLIGEVKASSDYKIQYQAGIIHRQQEKIEILREEFRNEMDSHEKTKRSLRKTEDLLSEAKSILAGKDAEIESAKLQVQRTEESKRMEFFKYFEEKQAMSDKIRSLEAAIERQKELESAMKYQLEKTISELFLSDDDEPNDFAYPEPHKPANQSLTRSAVAEPPPEDSSVSAECTRVSMKAETNPQNSSPGKTTPAKYSVSPSKPGSIGRASGGNTSDQLMAALKRAKQKQQKTVQKLVEEKKGDVGIKKGSSVANKIHDFKRPSKESSTQTCIANDYSPDDNSDAFFDISEGWVLPVSHSIVARHRWRAALEFVKCRFCRGIGSSIAKVGLLLRQSELGDINLLKKLNKLNGVDSVKEFDEADFDHSSVVSGILNVKVRSEWKYPRKWTDFICHIPKTLQYKAKIYPLHVVVARLLNVLTLRRDHREMLEKCLHHDLHAENGEPKCKVPHPHHHFHPHLIHEVLLQKSMNEDDENNLIDFLCDSYLLNCVSRLDAEKQLYMLLMSMKEYYKTQSLVNIFGRFLRILDGPNKNQVVFKQFPVLEKEYHNQDAVSIVTNSCTVSYSQKSLVVSDEVLQREEARLIAQNSQMSIDVVDPIPSATTSNMNTGDVQMQTHTGFTDAFNTSEYSLTDEMLSAYCFIRGCLLHSPYTGVYEDGIAKAKKGYKAYRERENLLRSGSMMHQFKATSGSRTHFGGSLQWSEIDVPSHVLLDENFNFFVPMDRVIRVIQAVFGTFMNQDGLMKMFRILETNFVCLLDPRTMKMYTPEGERVFIRTTMRKFTRNHSPNGADMGWDERELRDIDQMRLNARATKKSTVGKSTKENIAEAIADINKNSLPLMVNLELLMNMIVEKLHIRYQYSELVLMLHFNDELQKTNFSLTFKEFEVWFEKFLLPTLKDVKQRKAPDHHVSQGVQDYEERLMMQIYRHLLLQNNTKCLISKSITSQTCNHVSVRSLMCIARQYKLVKVLNEEYLSENTLSALYLSPIEVEATAEEVVVEKEFTNVNIQTDPVEFGCDAKDGPLVSVERNASPRYNLPSLSDAPALLTKVKKTKSQKIVQSKSLGGLDMCQSNAVPVNISKISVQFKNQEERDFVADAANRCVHPLPPLDMETKDALAMEKVFSRDTGAVGSSGNENRVSRPQRIPTKHMKPNAEISRTALWKIHAELEQKKLARLGLHK